MNKRTLRWAQAVLLGTLLSTCACAGGIHPLIEVGETRLYRPDLQEAAGRLFGEDAQLDSLGPKQRETLYRAVVIGELLTLEGIARGYHEVDPIRRELDEKEAELLVKAYEARMIDGAVEVNDDDIEARFLAWGSGEERRLGHILVETAAQADSLLGRLDAGERFEALAQAYSLHTESAPRGGDMGFLRRNELPTAIAELVWEAPAEQVYPTPVQTAMGFHVVRAGQRRVRSLAETAPQLSTRLLTEKTRARRQQVLDSLALEAHVLWRSEVAARMAARQELPADQALYRWKGGALLASDYLRRATAPQPVYRDTARLRLEAWRLVAADLMAEDARRRGWQNQPEVARPLARERAARLADKIFEVEGRQPASDEAEQRRFFDAHRAVYRSPMHVTVREILVDTQALADSLHALVKGGADMADLARRFTRRKPFQDGGGLWEGVEPGNLLSAKIYRLASQGEGLLAPLKVPGGYSVLRVLGKQEGPLLTFAEAKEAVQRDLEQIKMDEFLQSLEVKYDSQIKTTPFR